MKIQIHSKSLTTGRETVVIHETQPNGQPWTTEALNNAIFGPNGEIIIIMDYYDRERFPWRLWMYAPTNQGGQFLLALVFGSEHSFQMDLDIALKRRNRGEVGRITIQTPQTTEER